MSENIPLKMTHDAVQHSTAVPYSPVLKIKIITHVSFLDNTLINMEDG